jgi:hypothetical protein
MDYYVHFLTLDQIFDCVSVYLCLSCITTYLFTYILTFHGYKMVYIFKIFIVLLYYFTILYCKLFIFYFFTVADLYLYLNYLHTYLLTYLLTLRS